MTFRDLGIIELTVFAVLAATFLLFFILFVILRRRKQAANNRKLLKKQALMEEAVQKKVRYATGKGIRVNTRAMNAMQPEEYQAFSSQDYTEVQNRLSQDEEEVRQEELQKSAPVISQERAEDRVRKISYNQENSNFAGRFQEEFSEDNSIKRRDYQEEFSEDHLSYQPEFKKDSSIDSPTILAQTSEFDENLADDFSDNINFSDRSPQISYAAQKDSVGRRTNRIQEPLRMWDNNSKSLRMAKHSPQDSTFFVEERRISHRRDQLKRLEEAK